MEWISVKEKLPKKYGWYKVKTLYGETVVPFINTTSGTLVWLLPDPTIITHWKPELLENEKIVM